MKSLCQQYFNKDFFRSHTLTLNIGDSMMETIKHHRCNELSSVATLANQALAYHFCITYILRIKQKCFFWTIILKIKTNLINSPQKTNQDN